LVVAFYSVLVFETFFCQGFQIYKKKKLKTLWVKDPKRFKLFYIFVFAEIR